MSIIHDALKKAQEQRKQNTAGVPYSSSLSPEAKKKPRIALIAAVLVFAIAVIAYLYIPAFHRPKVPVPAGQAKPAASPPKVVAQAKPEQGTDKIGTAPQKEQALDPGLRRNDVKTPLQKDAAPEKTETKPEQKQSGAIKEGPTAPAVPARPGQVSITEGRQATVKAPGKQKAAAGAYQRVREEPAEESTIRRTVARRTEDERINAQYNEALSAMNSGQLREAQRIFLGILARKPDHVESLNNMGVISASRGNKREAITYFKRILEYRANYPKAYNNIGLILMSDGDVQLAEEYFRKAISLEPESLEPYINLCALLRGQKKFQEAAKVLDVPIKRNIKDAMLFLSYAVVKDNLGQSEEAIKYYRQYLGLARPSETRNGVVERLRYLENKGK